MASVWGIAQVYHHGIKPIWHITVELVLGKAREHQVKSRIDAITTFASARTFRVVMESASLQNHTGWRR